MVILMIFESVVLYLVGFSDASENDEAKTPRKMADGTAIAREKDDVSIEK